MFDKQLIARYLPFILLLLTISLISYGIERDQFAELLVLYGLSFLAYWQIFNLKHRFGIKEVILLGLSFRLLLLFSVPALSDDFYRFFWDGMLTAKGYSPYLWKPIEFTGFSSEYSTELLSNMNSPAYHSVYPPVMQWIFSLSYMIGGEHVLYNIIALRGFSLVAELITIISLIRILELLKLPSSNLIIYVFNPLVIIELVGNLHTEVFMICMLSLSFLLLVKGRHILSSIGMSLAFLLKIWPLMFVPFFLKELGLKKFVFFSTIFLILSIIILLLFLNTEDITAMSHGLDLYFRKFEFNASAYYILRWIGWKIYGYNAIHIIGPFMAILLLLCCLWLFIKQNSGWDTFFNLLLIVSTLHLILSTTIHPWYVAPLIFYASLVRGYTYPLVWSGLIFLSYAHYSMASSLVNGFIFLEYSVVLLWILFEIRQKRIQSELN